MPLTISAYTPKVAPGVYEAVCTDLTTKISDKDGAEFRIWQFSLTDGTGRTVTASSSNLTSQASKGGKWIAALIGRVPSEGESVEPVGNHCQIVVELNENGYERVTSVLPSAVKLPARQSVSETIDQSAPPPVPLSGVAPDELPF